MRVCPHRLSEREPAVIGRHALMAVDRKPVLSEQRDHLVEQEHILEGPAGEPDRTRPARRWSQVPATISASDRWNRPAIAAASRV